MNLQQFVSQNTRFANFNRDLGDNALPDCVLATTHSPKRSDRYSHVNSLEIVNSMRGAGWNLTKVNSRNSRTSDSQEFGLHELIFTNPNLDLIPDPRRKPINHHQFNLDSSYLIPMARIRNSHNGASKLVVSIGLFAILCSNGLIVPASIFGGMEHRHVGFNTQDALSATDRIIEVSGKVIRRIPEYSQIEMDKSKQLTFAKIATGLRWGKDSEVLPEQLLTPRREEDKSNDLWTVFNRIQENVVKSGDYSIRTGKRKARNMGDFNKETELNTNLWEAMEIFSKGQIPALA